MDLDFNNLTLVQIVIALFAIASLDWVAGVGVAVKNGTFNVDYVANFLSSHILARVIPLSFAAAVGKGIPQVGLEPILAIWAIFLLGAATYVAETVSSIAKNIGARNQTSEPVPSGETPQPTE